MCWVDDYSAYRYGFNGLEKDDEIKGRGNSYTTEFRQYDTRLGRWTSLDPLMAKFPHTSPYVAFANNPIYYTDPYGLAPNGPGDREINRKINRGKGDALKAGVTEEIASGTVVYADVSLNSAGQKSNLSYSNAYQIAKANGVSLDELYAMNPGLKENKNEIGQGQMIFVKKSQYGISGDTRVTIEDAKSEDNSNSWWDLPSFGKKSNEPDYHGDNSGSSGTNTPPTPYKDVEERNKRLREMGEDPDDWGFREHSTYQEPYDVGEVPFSGVMDSDTFRVPPNEYLYKKINDDTVVSIMWSYKYEDKHGKWPSHLPLIKESSSQFDALKLTELSTYQYNKLKNK